MDTNNFKYLIVINQKVLYELTPAINFEEAALLDYLIKTCMSKNPRIEKQRELGYTWFDYGKILDDMPLLKGRTKKTLTDKIKRLVEFGYILAITKNSRGRPRKYIRPTEMCNELVKDGAYFIDRGYLELFLSVGVNDDLAIEMASHPDFLRDKKDVIRKDIEGDGRAGDKAAYLNTVYDRYISLGL